MSRRNGLHLLGNEKRPHLGATDRTVDENSGLG